MSGFTAIALDKLPAPDVVEQIDYEQVLSDMVTDLLTRAPELADTIALESEPLRKLLEVCAYRETLLRQRVNEASKAVMLASAQGGDLDQIAANYQVQRLLIDAGDPDAVPPVPPTYEDDANLRRRVQLSFEGFSTAGPEGAYIFHALSADADVRDASATSPEPGDVLITILSTHGDGAAPPALLSDVEAFLSAEDVRPLTDRVSVQSAQINRYTIEAILQVSSSGPDTRVVQDVAIQQVSELSHLRHRIGQGVPLSAIYAALHQPGVISVDLKQPQTDIAAAATAAPFCSGIHVSVESV